VTLFKSKSEKEKLSTIYFEELEKHSKEVFEALQKKDSSQIKEGLEKVLSISRLYGHGDAVRTLSSFLSSLEQGEEIRERVEQFFFQIFQRKISGLFSCSMKEEMERVSADLMDLEAGKKPVHFEEMLRLMHSAKGNLALMGFVKGKELAHTVEELLKRKKYLSKEQFELLFRAVDLLQRYSDSSLESDGDVEETTLLLRQTIANLEPEDDSLQYSETDSRPQTSVQVNEQVVDRLLELIHQSQSQIFALQHFKENFVEERKKISKLLQEVHQICEMSSEAQVKGRLNLVSEHLKSLESEHFEASVGLMGYCLREEQLSEELSQEALQLRMRPFKDATLGFRRLIRDLSNRLSKEVDFYIEGEEVSVEREVVDALRPPLMHLLRNAVVHGIEEPDHREEKGKPRSGKIQLNVVIQDDHLILTLQDDGRGVDLQCIREKIALPGEQLPFSDEELMELLFLPQFSTAPRVTEDSGRGMGLSVVQKEMEALGGEVCIETKPGKGTCFTLQLPRTLTSLRCLLFTVGGVRFALPVDQVERVMSIPVGKEEIISGKSLLQMRGEALENQVLLIRSGQKQMGLTVEKVLEESVLTLCKTPLFFEGLPGIRALAFTGEGGHLVVLDKEALFAAAKRTCLEVKKTKKKKRVLVVDDSSTVRELFKGELEQAGCHVETASHGLEAFVMIRGAPFDLLVTDAVMPKLGGIDLIRLVKKNQAISSISCYLMSSSLSQLDEARSKGALIDRVIHKDEALSRILKEICN